MMDCGPTVGQATTYYVHCTNCFIQYYGGGNRVEINYALFECKGKRLVTMDPQRMVEGLLRKYNILICLNLKFKEKI